MTDNLDLNFEQLIDLGPKGVTSFYKKHRKELESKWKNNKYRFIVMICDMYTNWLVSPKEYLKSINQSFKLLISLLLSNDSDYRRLWNMYPNNQLYRDIDKYIFDDTLRFDDFASRLKASIGKGDLHGQLEDEMKQKYQLIFNEKIGIYKLAIEDEKENAIRQRMTYEMDMFHHLMTHLRDLYSLVINNNIKDLNQLRVTASDIQTYNHVRGTSKADSAKNKSTKEKRKKPTTPPAAHDKSSPPNNPKHQKRSTSNGSATDPDSDEAVIESPDYLRRHIEKIAAQYRGKDAIKLTTDKDIQSNINALREKVQQVTTMEELVPFAYWFLQLTKIPPYGFSRPPEVVLDF